MVCASTSNSAAICADTRAGQLTQVSHSARASLNTWDLKLTRGKPSIYDHRSEGSDKIIHSHFCGNCGTGLYYTFERYDGVAAVHAGTFDEPNWFDWSADNARHIFLSEARHGTVIPAGLKTYDQHATENHGTPIAPTIFETHHMINRRS